MNNSSKKCFQFKKATSPLKGDVCLLGDKSLAHRAMLFGALAKGKSTVTNFPDTGVTRAMASCLQALGVQLKVQNCTLEVDGNGLAQFGKKPTRDIPICDCKNSATTMRLLLGALVGSRLNATAIGTDSLSKRPLRVDEALRDLGIDAIDASNGHLPAYVHPSKADIAFPSCAYELKHSSAQVKSALLLAALCSRQKIILSEKVPTRDHTENMLRSMGLDISDDCDDDRSHVICAKPLVGELDPLVGKLPSDPSSAAFVFSATALVPGSEVVVRDMLLNENRIGFLSVLERMGCTCARNFAGFSLSERYGDVELKAPPVLNAVTIDDPVEISQMIDELPAIAMLMARANGISTLRNARELRFKESDRIKSILQAYQKLGLSYHEYEDGFSVVGQQEMAAKEPIETFNDHRIAMAFSLLGLVGDVAVDDADVMRESFNGFEETIERMRT